jgi:hypothetical protein
MSSLQNALQVDAFDAHVLAYGVEFPLVQACSEGTDAKEDLGDEPVVMLPNSLEAKNQAWKEEAHQPERRGELDVCALIDAGQNHGLLQDLARDLSSK